MSDLLNGAAPPAAAEPSLRDELSAAFTAPETPDTPEALAAHVEGTEPAAPIDGDRPRDEHGRFAPKDAAAKPAEVGKEPAAPATPPDPNKPATVAPVVTEAPVAKIGPPPGWPVAAKGMYDGLPQPVKDAIAKREEEVNKGFADLREFKALKPYVENATKAGVPLTEALDRYIAADRLLESDPVRGIQWLAQTFGVDLRQFAGAQHQPQPAAPQAHAAPFNPQALQPHLQPLLAEIEGLKRVIHGDKQASVQAEIDKFFTDPANRYAENVAPQMEAFIRSGQAKTLAEAYEMAVWANPEIRTQLISEQASQTARTAADKARQIAASARGAGKSITGAPPATPALVPQSDNLRADLEAQFAAHRA